MRFWISTSLAVLSFVLLVCLIPLWVRSQRMADGIDIIRNAGKPGAVTSVLAIGWTSNSGGITAGYTRCWCDDPRGMSRLPVGWGSQFSHYKAAKAKPLIPEGSIHLRGLGFELVRGSRSLPSQILPRDQMEELTMLWHHIPFEMTTQHDSFMSVLVPDWFIAILLILPPLAWVRRYGPRRRRRDRRRQGLCEACGYDLRGSHGKCPECGKMPTGVLSSQNAVSTSATKGHA
jgi:hypothetical protein